MAKREYANNRLSATRQAGQRANRYDVTVLVNGLPLVHIDLNGVE